MTTGAESFWTPTWGWRVLTTEQQLAWDLNLNYIFEMWSIEWLGHGMTFKLRWRKRE